MKLLSGLVFLLFASVILALIAMHNPGYVLIERAPWSIEMPLTLFVLLLIGSVILLYIGIHVTLRILHIPRDVGRWRIDRRLRQGQRSLQAGLIKLVEGDYIGAEKDLAGEIKGDNLSGIHYLAAACAAAGQGARERRDAYLTAAQPKPDMALATGVLQARLYETGGEQERALATLNQLHISYPGNRTVLRLLAHLTQALKDWTTLTHLAPELRRHKAMDNSEIDRIEITAHRELLTVAASSNEPGFEMTWQAIPKSLRQNETLLAIYLRGLIRRGESARAEPLLVNALRQAPTTELFRVYGELHSNQPLRLLSQGEVWLRDDPQNTALLLSLAKLAHAGDLPGKTREYAERAARGQVSAEGYLILADMMEKLGEETRAREYCRLSALHRHNPVKDVAPERTLLRF